jgi:hypothetical protein
MLSISTSDGVTASCRMPLQRTWTRVDSNATELLQIKRCGRAVIVWTLAAMALDIVATGGEEV